METTKKNLVELENYDKGHLHPSFFGQYFHLFNQLFLPLSTTAEKKNYLHVQIA